MSRSQGLFTGTFLVAAFFLRVGGGLPSESKGSSKLLQATSSVISNDQASSYTDGPWLASCRYWAPSRNQATDQASNPTPHSARVQIALQPDKTDIDVKAIPDDEEGDPECGSDLYERWGIPNDGLPGGVAPQIATVIAIVPDPIHTHLSLGFDRTVQVLLQAAADNGYLSSYYWLPWRADQNSGKASETSLDKVPGRPSNRGRQPGLIILKHNSDPRGDVSPSSSFYAVTYVFLVAETPTEGIDGYEFQSAISYKRQIDKMLAHDGDQVSDGEPVLARAPILCMRAHKLFVISGRNS